MPMKSTCPGLPTSKRLHSDRSVTVIIGRRRCAMKGMFRSERASPRWPLPLCTWKGQPTVVLTLAQPTCPFRRTGPDQRTVIICLHHSTDLAPIASPNHLAPLRLQALPKSFPASPPSRTGATPTAHVAGTTRSARALPTTIAAGWATHPTSGGAARWRGPPTSTPGQACSQRQPPACCRAAGQVGTWVAGRGEGDDNRMYHTLPKATRPRGPWEPVPPGYAVGGRVTRPQPMGLPLQSWVHQVVFIFGARTGRQYAGRQAAEQSAYVHRHHAAVPMRAHLSCVPPALARVPYR